jgi:ribosome-associated protein
LDVKEKVRRIVAAALDKKAEEPVVFHTEGLTDLADYIVVCSGTSDRHVKSIANGIEEMLYKIKEKPIGTEGETEGRWVLIDGADVIVHVFYKPVREFYALDKLWMDAPRFIPDVTGNELHPVSGEAKANLGR